MTFTQDTRNSATYTADNRTAVGTFTQNSKTTSGYLWSASVLPWTLDFPWLWENTGSVLTLDTRN